MYYPFSSGNRFTLKPVSEQEAVDRMNAQIWVVFSLYATVYVNTVWLFCLKQFVICFSCPPILNIVANQKPEQMFGLLYVCVVFWGLSLWKLLNIFSALFVFIFNRSFSQLFPISNSTSPAVYAQTDDVPKFPILISAMFHALVKRRPFSGARRKRQHLRVGIWRWW